MSEKNDEKHETAAAHHQRNAFGRLGSMGRTALLAVVCLASSSAPTDGAEPDSSPKPFASPPTGAPEGYRVAWDRTYSIVFAGTPLRQVVERLASTSGMTVVLDRRIDPERPITLDARDVSLGGIWSDLAASNGLGVSWVGPVVYLGPPETAAKLRTLAALRRADAGLLPPDLRAALAAKKSAEWADLEEPGSLLTRWTAEAGLRQDGPGVPHDLWPAARWPSLSLVDRLTLVAAEFDRTFAVDPAARTVTLAPIPETVAIERSYPAPPGAADTVRRWQGLAPQAAIRLSGDRLVVVGREEDHEAIATGRARPAAAVAGIKPPAGIRPPAGKQVFKLRAKDVPLSKLIETLRKQGSDVRVDVGALGRAGINLDGLTTVDVDGATLVEVLEAAGKPLGLTARTVGTAVELVPRP